MRTITASQERVLSLEHRSEHIRVRVDRDGSGTFVDLRSLADYDWIDSVRWGQNVDKPVGEATIVLVRENYQLSLAPLDAASKFNQASQMIEVHRDVFVDTAVLPMDAQPVESDWEEQFNGKIYKIKWGGKKSRLTLKCRDQGGDIQSEFVETQTRHGGDFTGGVDTGAAPQQLDDVIQDVLDTHATSAPTLLVATTPSYAVNEYLQQKQPVLKAIRVLGMLIGFDVRYRWDNAGGNFRLTLIEPDRTPAGVDRTFDQNDYDDLPVVDISEVNVRNFIRVIYLDSTTNVRTIVERSDAASITRYGRRFMEITEGASSVIRDSATAGRLADAALAELEDPELEGSVLMSYFPKVQLMDFYRFVANDVHYNADQDLAVGGFTHVAKSGARSSIKTTMQLRGNPSMGKKRWLALDGGRPGVAAAVDTDGPAKPNVSCTVGQGHISITIDEPAETDWKTTEIYLDESTIPATTFPTRPSSALLVASGKQSRFDIGGLTPGTTVFVRAIVVDLKGNFIATTDLITDVPERTGAFHENTETWRQNLVGNPQFGQQTKPAADEPPDGWSMKTGDWDDDATVSTSITHSGGQSLHIKELPSRTVEIVSDFIPYEPGDILEGSIVSRAENTGGATDFLKGFIDIYFGNKTTLSSSSPQIVGNTTASFVKARGVTYRDTAGSARYAQFRIELVSGIAPNQDHYIDSVKLTKALGAFSAEAGTQADIATGTDVVVNFDDDSGAPAFDRGEIFDTGNNRMDAPFNGISTFTAQVGLLSLSGSESMDIAIRVNGSRVKASNTVVATTGGTIATVTAELDLDEGDLVDVVVQHDGPGTGIDLETANTVSFFTGSNITRED